MSLLSQLRALLQADIKENPRGIITRQELINYFPDYSPSYTGVFLSNAEVTAEHSPTYTKCFQRLSPGTYCLHPDLIR